MATEAWFRNPHDYIRELVEVGVGNICWDRGTLVKKSIDPVKHASLYFGNAIDYRVLLVGDQGTAELRQDSTMEKPHAVYPTWCYTDELALLEELIEQPVGQDMVACNDRTVPPDERPVWGQEHRIVITGLPPTNTGPGRKMLTTIKELQEDNPECILHVHGLYGWRVAFGMGLGAADVEPRTAAQKGKVHLPSGKEEKFEAVQAHPQWVTVLGFKPVELAVPRNRCMYNIKSALWAAENYDKLYNFKSKAPAVPVDHTSSDEDHEPETTTSHMSKAVVKPVSGDKFHCNTCSLQNDCKYFRDGAVCSVPGAEPRELAKFFKTRDSETIIDGLGTLLAANTRRLERGLREEEAFGDLNPEVSRAMGQVFDQGVKLAKLVDPNLRGGTKVNVNVGNGGAATVSTGNPRQLIAAAVRELEARGIPRENITEQMIQGLLTGMNDPEQAQRAIEGTVLASRDEK